MDIFKAEAGVHIEDGIHFLKHYEPFQIRIKGTKRKNPKFDHFSRMILRLKEKQACAVSLFSNWIERVLIPIPLPIVVVPSHEPDMITGIQVIGSNIANSRINATGCLIRTTAIPKQAHSSKLKRDELTHLKSIKVIRQDLIRDKTVLLLDDIATTGATLNACASMLLQAGAEKVIRFALGKTKVS